VNQAANAADQINPRALKHVFGRDLLERISDSVVTIYPEFGRESFVGLVLELDSLEMKQRVRVIRDELRRQLPDDYSEALYILLASARNDKLSGFDFWPYTEFVQTYGMDDVEASLDALKQLTKVFTSEWAVRPFIARYPEKTMRFLEQCAQDKDVHVRRWASEGSRPRLPWGERLQAFILDPLPTLGILEKLKCDPELFVRRSVANHLNDIAKDHPEFVVRTLARWESESSGDDRIKIDWIIRTSLRTLIKSGDLGALRLIGVERANIEIEQFKIMKDTVKLGDRLDFEVVIRSASTENQKLVIDYIIHFVKANASTAPKVFKGKTIQLPAKEVIRIVKHHDLKKINTREYYAGLHSLEIQINGVVAAKEDWMLEV
jgi:3-methyladenine DNA glycosylase AlkC